MNQLGGFDPLYVAARRVLLDALEALGEHSQALILVGAQAVYMRTGDGDLAITPYTTDGDLAIDPRLLEDQPLVEGLMKDAGFLPGDQPGMWLGEGSVRIDLLAPEGLVSSEGNRGARIPPHSKLVARKTPGLDPCVLDFDWMKIGSLDELDVRTYELKVAGPAGLILAKSFKLAEREGTKRLNSKDAIDIFRLLRGTDSADLAERFGNLRDDVTMSSITATGLEAFLRLFGSENSPGTQLASVAMEGLEEPAVVTASIVALVQEFRAALNDRRAP